MGDRAQGGKKDVLGGWEGRGLSGWSLSWVWKSKVEDGSTEHVRRASVGKGWLVYIGIHQLSRCVRVMGTTSVTFGKERFKYGKEENWNKF